MAFKKIRFASNRIFYRIFSPSALILNGISDIDQDRLYRKGRAKLIFPHAYAGYKQPLTFVSFN